MNTPIDVRRLGRDELSRVAEIDRSERNHGYEPMAEALPELYELEPEDVHLRKMLSSTKA